ncbi:MAG: Unknown protein [uncultured Sulfurovum sp.]|uniref:FIST domain-containing protein n=1 Tax=uncultured Sulfurovum sp. TaxID=269237 RepID=A0A6S6SHQ0_9BACT|nr:MAG: Unknown protein [uncultured Sulfurovum sp.]
MRVQVNLYENGSWNKELDGSLDSANTLITVFSSSEFKKNEIGFNELCKKFPNAIITGCSTGGEIYKEELHDGSLSVSITKFEKTKIIAKHIKIENEKESFDRGCNLVEQFEQKGLKSLFILSDSITVNSSSLVDGFNSVLSRNVIVTGGMASDSGKFEKTWVFVDRKAMPSHVSAIGFYGDNIEISYASEGGWNRYGLERLVTSSDNKNTIYTVDDKPILKLYKDYMGEHSKNLPSSAFQFPILVIDEEGDTKVRAVFAANEETQSISVYSEIKEGNKIIFLKGSPHYIIGGAQQAAQNVQYPPNTSVLALVVSCVGRRAVLQEQTEDEVEIIEEVFNDNVSQVGFYSHGELSPQASGKCGLFNQTMTLSLIWES